LKNLDDGFACPVNLPFMLPLVSKITPSETRHILAEKVADILLLLALK